jgi:putative acyl-CoA dehydrogenase
VPTIIEMVNVTRLDCVLGSAGLIRRAVAEATHHAAHR